jgi:hypothetical protein
MGRLAFMLCLLTTVPLTVTDAAPEASTLARLHTARSDEFPISARGTDALENAAMLTLAEESYRTFLQTLGLPALPDFALRLTWDRTPLPPPHDPFASFPRKVETAPDGTRTFTIMARGALADSHAADTQDLRENFYRACMACYLQALVWSSNMTPRDGGLTEPPFWLREGLTQQMMKSRHEMFLKIARNYRQRQRLPALEQVQGWREFADDFLSARWQQTFSYWLLRLATKEAASRQALALWLSSGNYAQERSFLAPDARNQSWWDESLSVSDEPSRNLVESYDWDQTVALLNQCRHLSVVLKPERSGEAAQPLVLALKDLPPPARLQSTAPVRKAIETLANLQLKAHPAWAKIIEFYRLTLELWQSGNQVEFKKCFAAIEVQERDVYQYMTLVGDYMEWVTANTPVDWRGGRLTSSAKVTREVMSEGARLKIFAPVADSERR